MANVAAIVLAAGISSRFRETSNLPSKLVAPFAGMPMVAHIARMALASRANPVLVVTGHARPQVEAALAGLPVSFVHNHHFETGLASSLKAGIAALPPDCAGALILLGDMPRVAAATCDALIEALAIAGTTAKAVIPVWQGEVGNPILLTRQLFQEIALLQGDQGARKLLRGVDRAVVRVDVADAGILADADTPEALAALQAAPD